MRTLKFISQNEAQSMFAAAIRKNVNAYFKEKGISVKGDWRMHLKAFFMLTFYLAPFVILLTVPMGWLPALLLILVIGIGEAGIGMSVMHDAAHGAFSEKKWVNTLFANTMYLLGSNTFNWKIQHNIMHHTFTNVYTYDPDIDTKAVIRLCDQAPIKKFHRYQHYYAFLFYGFMTLSKLVSDFGQLAEYNREGITAEQQKSPSGEMIKLIIAKLIYAAILFGLPLLFTDFTWWQILIGFCTMHLIAGMIMSTVFQMAHVVEGAQQPIPSPDGIIQNNWMVHELNSTSDFARNSHFLNWYIGGLNYQIEHHLFPNTCHIHYPAIALIVEKTAKEFGFNYNLKPSFLNALGSHLKRLKELGRKGIDLKSSKATAAA